MDEAADHRLALAFGAVLSEAGRLVMEARAAPNAVRYKADGSPVTDADERAQDLIARRMRVVLPGAAILGEEGPRQAMASDDVFVLIDPLDGTKEYLSGRRDFTVNLALVRGGAPVLGGVFAPARAKLYLAGAGAFVCPLAPGDAPRLDALKPIRVRPRPLAGLTALTSRSHLDAATGAFLAALPIARTLRIGSSLKFCAIAAGVADVYPRLAPTMEWDTAAGHAVLIAAGGSVTTNVTDTAGKGAPLVYGKRAQSYRNSSFVAWGGAPEAAASS